MRAIVHELLDSPWFSGSLLCVLLTLVVLSGFARIDVLHQSHQRFAELQTLHYQRDALHQEWTKLVLEQGAWGAHARIERVSREQLHMKTPELSSITVVAAP
ncbi:MAG: cell division protein FtsL [Pseudomonadota bacterium]